MDRRPPLRTPLAALDDRARPRPGALQLDRCQLRWDEQGIEITPAGQTEASIFLRQGDLTSVQLSWWEHERRLPSLTRVGRGERRLHAQIRTRQGVRIRLSARVPSSMRLDGIPRCHGSGKLVRHRDLIGLLATACALGAQATRWNPRAEQRPTPSLMLPGPAPEPEPAAALVPADSEGILDSFEWDLRQRSRLRRLVFGASMMGIGASASGSALFMLFWLLRRGGAQESFFLIMCVVINVLLVAQGRWWWRCGHEEIHEVQGRPPSITFQTAAA